jgi:integrase
VNKALHTRAQAIGLAPFTPHDLRRTFISQLLEAGSDLATVQALAGHQHIDTTTLYDRRGEQAKRKAMRTLPFPT